MFHNIILITIDLSKLPNNVTKDIINIVKKSNKRYLLENQILSVDFNTMKLICDNTIYKGF